MSTEFTPKGFTVKTTEFSYWFVYLISIFVKELNMAVSTWDYEFDIE